MSDEITLTRREEELLLGLDAAISVSLLSTCGLAIVHTAFYFLSTPEKYISVSAVTCTSLLLTSCIAAGLMYHRTSESKRILSRKHHG